MAQAEPAYYGILEQHKIVCPDGYSEDGQWVTAKDDFEYPHELIEAVQEYLTAADAGTDWDESYLSDERTHDERIDAAKKAICMESASEKELIDAVGDSSWQAAMIVEELELGDVVAYQKIKKLRTDSLSLTHKGILQTCDLNGHNFKKPYNTYAMTAIRSPEIATLKSALRKLALLSDHISPTCETCQQKMTLADIDIDDGIVTITFRCDKCKTEIIRQYNELTYNSQTTEDTIFC
jgi:hypothetical protein